MNKLTFEEANNIFEYNPNSPSGLYWKIYRAAKTTIGSIAGSKMTNKTGHTSYTVLYKGIAYPTAHIVWLLHYKEYPIEGNLIHHIVPLTEGGGNNIENLESKPRIDHTNHHSRDIARGIRKSNKKQHKYYYRNSSGSSYMVRIRHTKTGKPVYIANCKSEDEAEKYVQAALTVWKTLYPECY